MLGPSKRSLLRMLEREREACAAERRELLDRIMVLADKPWTLPPRPLRAERPEDPALEIPEFEE